MRGSGRTRALGLLIHINQSMNGSEDSEPEGATDMTTTADGVPITEGMLVFTNNLDIGYVVLGTHPHSDGWFDVALIADYQGRPRGGKTMQDASRVSTTYRNGHGRMVRVEDAAKAAYPDDDREEE